MKTFLIVAGLILAFAASFFFGTRLGVTAYMQAEAQYRASITAGELRLLERQRIDTLKEVKEIELNRHLADHGRYMDSKFKWLWPMHKSKDNRPIKSAVRYRVSRPFHDPDLSKPEGWKEGVDLESPFVQDVIAGQKENQAQIRKVLEAYSP